MITFRFDINKAIQVVGFLLKQNKGQINYTKLIKLLYIADRKSLEEWDITITGDAYCSMPNGPVLSSIYDLIKDKHFNVELQKKWNKFFKTKNHSLVLKREVFDEGKLNDSEIEILKKVDREFKDSSFGDLIDFTHNKKVFPEVKSEEAEAKNTSIPLRVEDILEVIGRSREEIDKIRDEVETHLEEQIFFENQCNSN